MSKLLPCPFCGGEAKQTYINFQPAIKCDCGACFIPKWSDMKSDDENSEYWNTRKPMEKIKESLKKERTIAFLTLANTGDEKLDVAYQQVASYMDKAIEIVQKEVRND